MSRLSDPMIRISDFAAKEPHRHTPRERTLFYRELRAICRWSYRHAYAWIAVTAILCIPAFLSARHVKLDTDLRRLLPEHSAAVVWSEDLEPVVGDGGFFSIIFEGADVQTMQRAVDDAVRAFRRIEGMGWIDYQYPTEFIDNYRYTLIPSSRLEEMIEVVEDWEAQVNPFLDDLGDAEPSDDDEDGLEKLLSYYEQMPLYHEAPEGDMIGMLVSAQHGISNLGEVQRIYSEMDAALTEIAERRGVQFSIGGSMRTRVEEFQVIIADVTRMGTIAIIAILLTLVVSFRSIPILPVVIYPLAASLLWAFAFVPWTVGHLNTITSFLLMVLFGMGVDYSIHLVKRFRHELVDKDPETALIETFTSTGRSVMTSGATTALGLMILAISDFRGFSDFGIIGGSSMVVVTLAMLFVMPATLIVGHRWGLVRAKPPMLPSTEQTLPPRWVSAALAGVVVVAGLVSIRGLSFDYDFTNFSANSEELDRIRDKQDEIYPLFFGPAAIYVAPDLETLDATLEILGQAQRQSDSAIESVSSVRDFAPTEAEAADRRLMIADLREMLSGRWTRRVEDPNRQRLIADFRDYEPTDDNPTVESLPDILSRRMLALDGSGEYVVAVDSAGPSKDGRITMQFTREIYDLEMPEALRGPTGDKPVLAEILWLVTSEAPRIVLLTFLGILILVVIDRRSFRQAIWVLLPLVASLLLTFGAMVLFGWKLNFFNMVVLPSLLGLGVDHGIHYYRRWRELDCNTADTQSELFEPITVATLTTIMGYAGMAFARHPGLRSIGNLAVLGLTCTWITALILLPGLLSWREHMRRKGAAKASANAAATAKS